MAKPHRAASFVLSRTSLFIVVKALLTITIIVYAVSTMATSRTYQAITGGSITVTNALGSVDKGFAIAPLNVSQTGTCPVGNVTFGPSPGTANTPITANDYVYDIQVSTTAITTPNSCFTASLILKPAGGPPSSYGPVTVATGASVTANQTIDCKFDVGPTLPPSPFSFTVTVQ